MVGKKLVLLHKNKIAFLILMVVTLHRDILVTVNKILVYQNGSNYK